MLTVATAGSDHPFPRYEIHTLMDNKFQFSLFIQAMYNLQKKGFKPEAMGWQELAGIHGLPYVRWRLVIS